MSPMTDDVLARLRAANPVAPRLDHGHEPVAQPTLDRIVSDAGSEGALSRRRFWSRSPRGPVVVFAVLALGAGGALAATDPMGWWSASPTQAQFASAPGVHVRTPTAQRIRCAAINGGGYRCTAQRQLCSQTKPCRITGRGPAYERSDTIRPPAGPSFSRVGLLASIARARAQGTMTAAHAARFREDLARVPDGFFAEFRLATRYGTYTPNQTNARGQTIVPPVGVASILVCEPDARVLSCQDLNGDQNAPVGAGVYAAVPGPGWRVASPSQTNTGLPPGVHFTKPEYRVLVDMLRYAATIHSSTSSDGAPTGSR